MDELRSAVEACVKGTANHNVKNMANIPWRVSRKKCLKSTYLEAKKSFKVQFDVGTEHLLSINLRDEDNIATQIFWIIWNNYDSVKEMPPTCSGDSNVPRAKLKAEERRWWSSKLFGSAV